MAKETLIDIVQDILSDADSDDVSSISDTVESDQCARVVRDVFNQIVTDHDLNIHEEIDQLDATSSSTPNVMTRPEGLYDIQWIRYDRKTTAGGDQRYESIEYMDPEQFFNLTSRRTLSDSDTEAVALASGHSMLVKNDIAPTYYTFLQGYDHIIFDSYDVVLDTNLQASKSLVFAKKTPVLTLADASVPDLPKPLFILLKREARALFWDLYKGGVTKEVDRTRRRADVRAQRQRFITKRIEEDNSGPNYGRHKK